MATRTAVQPIRISNVRFVRNNLPWTICWRLILKLTQVRFPVCPSWCKRNFVISIKRQPGDRPKDHICDRCSKAFHHRSSLSKHRKRPCFPENTVFYCDYCSKQFKTNYKYRLHLDQHERILQMQGKLPLNSLALWRVILPLINSSQVTKTEVNSLAWRNRGHFNVKFAPTNIQAKGTWKSIAPRHMVTICWSVKFARSKRLPAAMNWMHTEPVISPSRMMLHWLNKRLKVVWHRWKEKMMYRRIYRCILRMRKPFRNSIGAFRDEWIGWLFEYSKYIKKSIGV